MNEVERRGHRVGAMIEDTPIAVDLRSTALEFLNEGSVTAAMFTAWRAAELVLEAHPEILREISAANLRSFLWSQVRALESGEAAELDLKDRSGEN